MFKNIVKQPSILLGCKFPLLIKFCPSSHLPLQCSDCQLIQLIVSKWFFWWKPNALDERAAWQTLLYPHLHAPNQTDIGRTPVCWGGAVLWLQLDTTQNSMFPLPLQQQNCPRSWRPHGCATLCLWSCSFLGSLCSQVCHKPQDVVAACKLCDIQTPNSALIQSLQLRVGFHLYHTYFRCFVAIYLEGYEQLQEQMYKLSSKGQI